MVPFSWLLRFSSDLRSPLPCRNYREENDPDYELPESDRVWESDVEEEEAEEEDIVTILVREAEEPLPDIQELEEG